MKDKENKRQESEEQENSKELEFGSSGGFSIFNDSYPLFMAYDLTRNLREEPIPEDEKKEKLFSGTDYDHEKRKQIYRHETALLTTETSAVEEEFKKYFK